VKKVRIFRAWFSQPQQDNSQDVAVGEHMYCSILADFGVEVAPVDDASDPPSPLGVADNYVA